MGSKIRAEPQGRILIVDDQRDSLVAIHGALEPLGLDVVRAQSGREALRTLLSQDFNLILLDVGMPEMDGFETATLIRESERHRRTPIVFLTGLRSMENVKRGYAAGAADYIEKPVEAETLRSKVAALVHLFRDSVAMPDDPVANILVVDDTPANLAAIDGALSTLRENIVTAGSGEEALALLSEQEFSVLLLDVILPGIDGIETAAVIRRNPRTRDLPIIVMSSLAQAPEYIARGYAVGAVDYLFPPVEPSVLRAKVAVFVDLFKKRERLRRHEEQIRRFERAESARQVAEERQAREVEAVKVRAAEELAATRAALIAELNRKNDELTGLNHELDAFTYAASHDLRAPLRAVDGFSRALLEDCADELSGKGQEHLRSICESSQQMGRLIEALLGLSRVSRTDLQPETVDVSKLGTEVLERLAKAAPDRKVEVVVDGGMTATGDRRLIEVMLENLLGNAWKFTARKPNGRIELVRDTHEDRPVFVVRDNGAGFDARYASKLFQPFQRLHTQTDFPGTGIGLATVHRIVRRHGGRIWAKGAVDQGAAFYFTLADPVADAATPAALHADVGGPPPGGR
ncbi:MAG: response regulator [Deltaproteobacteria bacterium]|nr:response regulator [Deltaproteobacteria bacterium]